jgi:hypothetical protein
MKLIKKYWPILLVLFAGIVATRTLLFQSGYFKMHDDLQMMRQLSMEKCFMDLQIPCRWIPDMGYGYGFPLFNFYPPLPYLVGETFRVFGFTFVDTVKITFALSIILSGVGMYFLAKEFFGKVGGVISAVFYIWAPYHSVDVYVRGAMNEAWALVFFPLTFYFSYRLIKNSKGIIPLALAWVGLLLSHNLMVLIFAPVFILWCLLWIWRLKINFVSALKNLIPSGFFALGLSAFFTIPALAENKFTWVKSQLVGYYDYTAHFVSLKQLLISRFWGYGPSVWVDAEDGMSFQIGHLHWILPLIIIIIFLVYMFAKKDKSKLPKFAFYLIPFLFIIGWVTSFMTHVRSTPIYQLIPTLALVQFPWRFITLIIFSFSFLIGAIVLFVREKIAFGVMIVLSLFVVIFNWSYFLPDGGKMGPLSDEEKFSAAAWDLQQTAGIYDYLPLTAREAPKAPQGVLVEAMKRNVQIWDMKQGTDWAEFNAKVEGDSGVVRINLLYFPGWKVWVDGKQVKVNIPEEEEWGRMWIDLSQGEHSVSARFTNTLTRSVSNAISIFSLAFLLLQFSLWKNKSTSSLRLK